MWRRTVNTDGGARTPDCGDIFIIHEQKSSYRTPLSQRNIQKSRYYFSLPQIVFRFQTRIVKEKALNIKLSLTVASC